jgi:hypothetical protein
VVKKNDDDDDEIDITKDVAVLAARGSAAAKVKTAMGHVRSAIYDQGVAGRRTLAAIPSLIGALQTGGPAAQAAVLGLLASVHEDPGRPDDIGLRAAIAKGKSNAQRLLDSDAAPVRAQTARLLSCLDGTGTAIAAHVSLERDPVVQAAMIYGAARRKQKAPDVKATSALLQAAIALAGELLGKDTTDGLVAAADDKRLAETDFPFLRGNVKLAAIGALGRLAATKPAARKALLARLKDEKVFAAIRDVAAPWGRKSDAAVDKPLLAALVEANVDLVAGYNELPSDRIKLRQLCGLEKVPERVPSPLDDMKLRKSIMDVVESKKPYAPDALLRELGKKDAATRARIALDLITGHDDLDKRWEKYPTNEMPIALRRRARVHDLTFRLLTSAPGAEKLIDETRATLLDLEKRGGGAHHYADPRRFLGVVRATLHVRARQKIPPPLVAELGKLYRSVMDHATYLPEIIVGKEGEEIAKKIDGQMLYWIADRSKTARERILKDERGDSKSGWGQSKIPRPCLLLMIEKVDPEELWPILKEIAKRDSGYGEPVMWTPPGATAPIKILTDPDVAGRDLNRKDNDQT